MRLIERSRMCRLLCNSSRPAPDLAKCPRPEASMSGIASGYEYVLQANRPCVHLSMALLNLKVLGPSMSSRDTVLSLRSRAT